MCRVNCAWCKPATAKWLLNAALQCGFIAAAAHRIGHARFSENGHGTLPLSAVRILL